eukprot:12065857-Alexandrium_andersonii.AAC.1
MSSFGGRCLQGPSRSITGVPANPMGCCRMFGASSSLATSQSARQPSDVHRRASRERVPPRRQRNVRRPPAPGDIACKHARG